MVSKKKRRATHLELRAYLFLKEKYLHMPRCSTYAGNGDPYGNLNPCVRPRKTYSKSILRTRAKPYGFAGLSFTKPIFKIKKALLLQCFPDFGEPLTE